jgi:hypothetical protein
MQTAHHPGKRKCAHEYRDIQPVRGVDFWLAWGIREEGLDDCVEENIRRCVFGCRERERIPTGRTRGTVSMVCGTEETGTTEGVAAAGSGYWIEEGLETDLAVQFRLDLRELVSDGGEVGGFVGNRV